MLKNKRILLIIILVAVLFLIPSICNAVTTYTTSDGIKVTKIVENTDGTIDFKFENISLSDEGQYTWGIGRSSLPEEVEDWYTLADYGENSKTAILTITPAEYKIKQILRQTDTVWLYIKDIKNNTYIVNALKVNLTLPISKVYNVIENDESSTFRSFEINNAVYGIYDLYYKFVKITDQDIINRYLKDINDGKEVNIETYATREQAPETGWKAIEGNYGTAGLYINPKPTEEGLYYIWIKGKDADSKTIIGCNLYYGDVNAPKVEEIYVNSPTSGTYTTGQTVKIRVGFSEVITGTTVPTLKIKFGDSEDREITNGTIVNLGNGNYYWNHYIEYSYDIQDSDKGQLATIEYKGGTIKDTSGNNAQLSCPVITGNTIKANVEGTNNNQTDNQDKNTSTQTTLSSIAITKTPIRNTYGEGESFDKAGMVITATYSDGTTKQITNYTISPEGALKTTDTKVVISYTENGVTKTVEQKITVIQKTASGNGNNGGNNNENNNPDNPPVKEEKDPTIKEDSKLPQTGATVMIFAVIALIAVAVISKVKSIKYKDI